LGVGDGAQVSKEFFYLKVPEEEEVPPNDGRTWVGDKRGKSAAKVCPRSG